ncbi:MAG: PAS domain S-box protein, partial [Ignavibacteria bacterium]
PSLILLDIVLPGMDGFKVLNELKQEFLTRNIPVILVTSKLKESDEKIKAISIGADSFLNFPVKQEELIESIKNVLAKRNRYLRINEYKKKYADLSLMSDVEVNDNALMENLKSNYEELIQSSENLMKEVEDNEFLLNELRKSETKFKVLFNSSRDSIFLVRKKADIYIITDLNETACNYFSTSPKDAISQKVHRILNIPKNECDEIIKMLLSGSKEYVEITLNTGSNKKIDVEIFAKEIRLDKETLIFLQLHDVTEKNKNLNFLKILLRVVEESPLSIIITDLDKKIIYCNRFCTELSGYESNEMIGMHVKNLVSGTHDESFFNEVSEILSGGDIWFGEVERVKKDGNKYWEWDIITPITDKDGIIINYACIGQDITERKRLIKNLESAKLEAEKANKLKSEFLAMISHEIRTPVNVLINYANLLVEDLLDNPNELVVFSREGIQNAGKRLIKTIDLLLNYSMLETGNFELLKKECNIEDIFDEATKEYVKLFKEKNIHFDIQILNEEKKLECDKYVLVQILINLLDNAYKFTNEGKVNLKYYSNAYGKKIISVEDTGIGITKEELENIFTPFYQEDKGYSRQFEGLGLGLSVVKRYCDLMNYKIKIDSQKNVGTKVIIILQ